MKKLLVLIIALVVCTIYIYSVNKDKEEKLQFSIDGITDHELGKKLILGGSVEKYHNYTSNLVDMQNDYANYYNGKISFSEIVYRNVKNLEKVSHYPFLAMKGNMFSVGYSDESAVQVYYQSAIDETRSVVYKVTNGKDKNTVEIIYDGPYLLTVTVDPLREINYVYMYDKNRNEIPLEVE